MLLVALERPTVIVTADDFGRDEPCTRAITECLVNGSVTAASIMANGRFFQLACGLARRHGVEDKIGVHLCLDEGPPLAPEMVPYTDAHGCLCTRRSLKPLTWKLSRAIEAELAAQIDRVLAAGIRPTHLDSHRHVHTAFPIGRLVAGIARTYGIPYVRPARNWARRRSMVTSGYSWLFNRYLSSQVRTADHFVDIVDFYRQPRHGRARGVIECMTHLDESPRGLENRRLLADDRFKRLLSMYQVAGHADVYR
jgi:chitin disaccharide deacetylase